MPKKGHTQVFRKEYGLEWPCLIRSTKSSSYAYCKCCKSDFKVSHGGRDDCFRHIDGSRHQKNSEACSSNKNIKEMFSEKENKDVRRAEALFVKFLINHNLPMSVADHACPLFKRMFPDSAIADKLKCARTKSSEIAKSFAKTTQDDLFHIMKNKKFCLATDGSNSISDEKLFPIVVTFFDEAIGKIITTLVSLPKLDEDGTGENIFSLIDQEFQRKQIPWENCVAFSADNASVMLGQHKGVAAYIKEKNPNVIIHGCACHLINLAAKHAIKKIDFNIENFLVDVYFYLKKSVKRIQLLKSCEEFFNLESNKIVKYGATRWLSMGKAIDRFLEKWEALERFFCVEEKGTSDTFKCLKKFFESKSPKLYLLFLQSVIPIFESCNLMMQLEEPLIYKYQRELTKLFSSLLSRFIKPASIMKASSIFDIKFQKQKHQKDDSELVIGGKARQYLKDTNLSPEETNKFYASVREFYAEALSYMVKKFPLTTEVYKNAELADIAMRHEVKFAAVEYFFNLFSVPQEQRNEIELEFAAYQIDSFNDDILSSKRCDLAWVKIAAVTDHNGAQKYKVLPSFMQTILTLPHSNSACERVFSLVKKNLTDYRSSLKLSTLEAILIEKCKQTDKCCFDAVLTENDLITTRKATFNALHSLADKN